VNFKDIVAKCILCSALGEVYFSALSVL